MRHKLAGMLAAIVVLSASTAAQAQKTVVCDLKKVFANYAPFQADIKAMEVEVDLAEREVLSYQAEIAELVRDKADLVEGTDEYKALVEKINVQKLRLSSYANEQKVKFARQEAEIYNRHFTTVKKAIVRYCEEHDIELVLRLGSDESEAATSDPDAIAQRLNRLLIHAGPRADITDALIRVLAQEAEDKPADEALEMR